jgi:hypothetical protein
MLLKKETKMPLREPFEIYFRDFNEEAQTRLLEFFGISISEGNFDDVPLFVIEIEPIEEN